MKKKHKNTVWVYKRVLMKSFIQNYISGQIKTYILEKYLMKQNSILQITPKFVY